MAPSTADTATAVPDGTRGTRQSEAASDNELRTGASWRSLRRPRARARAYLRARDPGVGAPVASVTPARVFRGSRVPGCAYFLRVLASCRRAALSWRQHATFLPLAEARRRAVTRHVCCLADSNRTWYLERCFFSVLHSCGLCTVLARRQAP